MEFHQLHQLLWRNLKGINMYLFGASGHCKVVIDMIQNSTTKIIEGVVDDYKKEDEILDIKIIEASKFNFDECNEFLISIGNNMLRKKIEERIKASYISIIHKSAIISKYANIGKGSVIMPNVVVNAAAVIGEHCIINTDAVVEHDCIINDFVHISPNASVAGNVTVGEGSHIGIGASIIQGIHIGKWVTVGAGAVVIRDVPDGITVVGNPACIIKP